MTETVDERIRRGFKAVCPVCGHNVHACERSRDVNVVGGYVVGVNHALGVSRFTHGIVEQANLELKKRGAQLQILDDEFMQIIDLLRKRKVLQDAIPKEPIGVG